MSKIFLFLLVAVSCFGASHYVRAGAAGTASGDDWTNAYTTLPATLTRGDTYYIADGNYSAYTFNDDTTNNTYIYIVKASVANHGTEIGWLDSYGDGQAIWTGTTGAHWNITRSYYSFDGSYRTNDTTGHGFVLEITSNVAATSGGCCVSVLSGSQYINGLVFKNVLMIGAGSGLDITPPALCRPLYLADTCANVTIDSCAILRSGQQCVTAGNMGPGWTISNSYFKNGGSGDVAYHGVMFNMYGVAPTDMNFTVKNCTFQDFMSVGGSGFLQLGHFLDIDFGYVYIYNNLFLSTVAGTDSASFLIGNSGDGDNHHTYFYHNTMVNLKRNMDQIALNGTTGDNYSANNMYYNCTDGGWISCNHENDYFTNTDVFQNLNIYDLRLSLDVDTSCVLLSSPYDVDKIGVSRSGQTIVNPGAYEYNPGYGRKIMIWVTPE